MYYKGWRHDVSREPGIYAIWDLELREVRYVGETSNLKKRLGDLERCVNHTCRRKLAGILRVSTNDESHLSKAIAARYTISFSEVFVGRAELEEYLVLRWRKFVINKPSPRLEAGLRYPWVKEQKPEFPRIAPRVSAT